MKSVKCIVCSGDRFKRGLCYQCYRNALTLVRNGDETYESLVRLKLMAPKKKSDFKKLYEARKHLHN